MDKEQPPGGREQKAGKTAINLKVVWGILFTFLLLAAVVLGQYLLDVILLIFAAILFAVILRIPGDWVHKHTPLSMRWATIVSLIVLVSLFVVIGIVVSPNVSRQMERISTQFPIYFERINQNLQSYPWAQQLLNRVKNLPASLADVGGVGNILEQVSGIFSGVVGVAANLIIFLVLSIYFAYEPRSYLNGVIRLIPPQNRQRAEEVIAATGEALKWWLIGRLIAMLILGVLVGVGLAVIGVPLAGSLGFITGLLSFVPIIGGIVAFFPAGFVALAESPLMFFYVFLLYLGGQTLENYLLTPIVQRQTVSLAPAVALIIQLVMGIIAGPVGIALAYPVAVVGQVLVRELYIKDLLENTAI